MKKTLIVLMLLLFPLTSVAAARTGTGNEKLDVFLSKLNTEVKAGNISKAEIRSRVMTAFGIKESSYKSMERNKLSPASMYVVGLIHKSTNVKVRQILSRSRGGKRSWRDVIYYYGATPEELDAMRKAEDKRWRKIGKKAKTEKRIPAAKESSKKAKVSSKKAPVERVMTLTTKDEVCQCRCLPKKKKRRRR